METPGLSKKKYLRWDEVLAVMNAHGMGICKATLYNWADIGTIISVRINGKIWFTKESIEDIINPTEKV